MGNNQKYSIDFKLLVVGKYKQGTCGYKKLAREFNLSRDTVRDWCLNPRLQSATQIAKKNKINDDKDLEYYINLCDKKMYDNKQEKKRKR